MTTYENSTINRSRSKTDFSAMDFLEGNYLKKSDSENINVLQHDSFRWDLLSTQIGRKYFSVRAVLSTSSPSLSKS